MTGEMPAGMPGAGMLGTVAGVVSGVAGAVSGAVGSVGQAFSAIGGILFKKREGVASEGGNAEAIQSRLGRGQSLEGGVRSRMEGAFGESFSGVEVHTDGNAAEVSSNLSARAFTVGNQIAFGAGEYQPGTMVGDALIAHELAHVVQQRSGGTSVESKQVGATDYNALEEDADQAAVGAVISVWGKKSGRLAGIASNAIPSLKTGMRLQRCSNGTTEEQAFMPISGDEREALARMRQNITKAEELLKDPDLSEEDKAAIKTAIQNARGTLHTYADIREQGQARTHTMAPIAIASTAIVADDATGVGVADDPLLIPLGLAAIAILIFTNPPAKGDAISEQWVNVGRAIEALGTTVSTVLMAQKVGEQVRGLTEILAVHLARLLGETVGGRPPDEPNDPKNFKHWWKEIKAFLKGIKDKGLSPKQLLRELQKKFTPEEIEAIKNAIRKAAEKMGEEPPEFL